MKKHEAALRRKLVVKDWLKKAFHDNEFSQIKYEQYQILENSSPITDSPAPISTSP